MDTYPKFIKKNNTNQFIENLKNNNNFKLYKILFIILCFLLITFIILYFCK